jgi:hypothetical protein
MNGVYIILGGNTKKDHATLWLGSEKNVIGRNNYIDNGGTVYFWELKEKYILKKCKCKLDANEIHDKLGCVHYNNIRKLLEKNLSKDELRLFDLLESKMKVGKIDSTRNTFNIEEGGILVNLKDDSSDIETVIEIDGKLGKKIKPTMPYQVIIHELWHNIDYLAKNKNSEGERELLLSCWYEDGKLVETIAKDIEIQVKKVAERNNLDVENDSDMKKARKKFYEGINQLIPSDGKITKEDRLKWFYLFDIIEGIISVIEETKPSLLISQKNHLSPLRQKEYWNPTKLSSEYFAAIGCMTAVGNKEALKAINDYLPESYNVYNEIIKVSLEKELNKRNK